MDHGLFLPLAHELSKAYKRVLYFNAAWVDGFPSLNKCIIGDGYPEIEVIEDYWPLKNEIDLFIFPDLYHAGEQLELESQGKAVWGSRDGDKMEIYRPRFLWALHESMLEVPPYQKVIGIANLRDYLKDKEDCYIKISKFRGTIETQHWRDWSQDEGILDEWAVELGAAKDLMPFLVFDAIDTDIEVGLDTYCIDGAYPDSMLVGYEHKDKGYFGAVTPASEIPKQLADVNAAFAPELSEHRYRNLISSEVRIKGEHFYFIDPTRRFPCPGSGSQMKLYANLPDIIWRGAQGELVQPEWSAKFASECVLTAKGEPRSWRIVDFPYTLRESLMCGRSCFIDGRTCWPPNEVFGDVIGWLVNTADTPKDCIQGMLDKVNLLPDGVTAATESLSELLKEIESGKEQGVEFTSKPLPEPAIVVENT